MTEIVEVPTAAHWRQFVVAPEGFEAGPSGLWKVAQKLEDEKGKQTWKCVFCQRCFFRFLFILLILF